MQGPHRQNIQRVRRAHDGQAVGRTDPSHLEFVQPSKLVIQDHEHLIGIQCPLQDQWPFIGREGNKRK